MYMAVLKVCPSCGQFPGVRRKYCDKSTCQRAASAARTARWQARRSAGEVGQPAESLRPPEGLPESFTAPWDQVYDSEADAYADCILTGGLYGTVEPWQQAERLAVLTGAVS